ncbi:hypothetical protein [Croceitalea vernalis]|uniref:Uncharacterized protein n=1 Tax=Croceitalea vernalis TaxID=3075599 RepID=A0ABU3BEZ8_9FLAO|nr:hypothetical protein [Croceitalea sp. P007]MDT0620745.1 hypothetical protein [Croceitalea sp. P007]
MKSRKINSDRILGISAMAISVLTLAIFIYQTDIMRVQSKLSVKPRLDFTTNQGGNDSLVTYQEVLENKGLGPAIIDSIYFMHEKKSFPLNAESFFEKNYPKLLEYGYLSQHAELGEGTTLTPNEERSLFVYKLPASNLESVFEYLGITSIDEIPFYIEVTFTSIYEDELWLTNTNKSVPKKIK